MAENYCEKHNVSWRSLSICPYCSVDRLYSGDVPSPFNDALLEAVIQRDCDIREAVYLLKLAYAGSLSEDLDDAIFKYVSDHGGF
jgi:hypothetical protein